MAGNGLIVIFLSQKLSKSSVIQNFKLMAEVKSEDFSQTVDIFMIPKRYSVFIQTDKPVYKPGDEVKFRILIVDLETKPYQLKKLRIEVLDGLSNVVRVFDKDALKEFENGVFVNKMDTSTDPITGAWKIRVTSNDISDVEDDKSKDVVTEQSFQVKEYALPRFEVIIDTNHDVTQSERFVKLKIYANYTFGEFAAGIVKVTAWVYDTKFMNKVHKTTIKTVECPFKKIVDFNIETDLDIFNEIRPYEVKFEVEFT